MVSTDAAEALPPNSYAERKIVVYTSNGCHKCAVLKEWLKTSSKYFEERSLEDVDVMTELFMRNVVVLSAPVLEVDGSIYAETQFFDGTSLTPGKLQEILESSHNG